MTTEHLAGIVCVALGLGWGLVCILVAKWLEGKR